MERIRVRMARAGIVALAHPLDGAMVPEVDGGEPIGLWREDAFTARRFRDGDIERVPDDVPVEPAPATKRKRETE